jgi:hypothetical protein
MSGFEVVKLSFVIPALTVALAASLPPQPPKSAKPAAPPARAGADAKAEAEGDFNRMTAAQLESGIEQRHPAAYYILAGKLFAEGSRDKAVFWFYAGQLRYRFHLAANPNLEKDGDPALFSSLSEVIGRPINEYAFGDIDGLMATMQDVLAWDQKTDNGFTSKTAHAEDWQSIREGLVKLREMLPSRADQIRATREKNGLENRKPKPPGGGF